MTISTQSAQVILLGNGATTVFNFPFVGAAAADIQVTYIDANNNSTVLSPSQYTLNLNAAAPGQLWGVGGTVTYPLAGPAIANGTFLVITRIVPFTQVITISNQGDFAPQVIEQAMDLLELQIQQVAARTGRYRGTWATGLVYYGGDVVVDGANGTNTGNFYMCALQNTSGVWATDLAAGDWVLAYIGLTSANIIAVLGYTPMRGSNNLSEISSAVTARGNLGLGSIATQNANNIAVTGGTMTGVTITGHASLDLAKASNLSDVASAATSRTNLGLGTMAVQNANAVAITGGTGAGLSFWGIGITPSYPLDVLLSATSYVMNQTAARIYAAAGNGGQAFTFTGLDVTCSLDHTSNSIFHQYGLQVTTKNSVAIAPFNDIYGFRNIIDQVQGVCAFNIYGNYISIGSSDNTILERFYGEYTLITLPDNWSDNNCWGSRVSIVMPSTAVSCGGIQGIRFDDMTFAGSSSVTGWDALYIGSVTVGNNGSLTNYYQLFTGALSMGQFNSVTNFFGLDVGAISITSNLSQLTNYYGVRVQGLGSIDATSGLLNVYGLYLGNFKGPNATTGDGVPIFYNGSSGTARLDAYGFWKDGGDSVTAAQFDKTTSTVLANITSLTATININTKYKFRAVLFVNADATGGHKYAIGGTAVLGASGSIVFQTDSERNDTSAKVITSRLTALNGTGVGAAGGTTMFTVIEGYITLAGAGATAGTLTVQFAQNASNGTSSVLIGSTFDVAIAG